MNSLKQKIKVGPEFYSKKRNQREKGERTEEKRAKKGKGSVMKQRYYSRNY